MQQFVLHKRFYQIRKIDEAEYGKEAYKREKILKLFKQLRKEGTSEKTALVVLGISRSSLFRWSKKYNQRNLSGLENEYKRPHKLRTSQWSKTLENDVLALRKANPLYGKYKIHAVLRRTHKNLLSASTIGRIISLLIKKEKIKPAAFYYSGRRKKPRVFNGHSKRLPSGMKATKAGELVQFDHMSVYMEAGRSVKHFQATCPISKIVVEEVYHRATSNIAAQFLAFAQEQFPFPILSIQIDGGSEFRGDFEQACKIINLPLFVLPPRSPKLNGVTERANGSAKYEFYALYTGPLNLTSIRSHLKRYVHKFNHFRPHQSLLYMTPMQYYQNQRGQKSHMY